VARNLFADDPIVEQPAGNNLFSDQPAPQTQGEKFIPQVFEHNKQEPTTGDFVEGSVQSALKGATLGFNDEIQSFIAAAVASPFISDKTFSALMVDARNSFREDHAKFKEANPGTAMGLELAGGLATGGAGLARSAGVNTLKQAITHGVTSGAKIGTAVGVGNADQENFFSQGTVEEGFQGTLTGSLFGGSFPVFAKAVVQSGKLIPKELPAKMLESALKFKPSLGQKERKRATETALSEGIMPTVRGLEKIAQKITKLDAGLNKIIDDATSSGLLIPKKALFTELKQLRRDLGGAKLDAAGDLARIDKVAKAFDEQLKSINKSKLTPREAQDLKRSAYQRIKFDVSQTSANFAETEAKKSIVRSSRKSLESIDDNVKEINRREGNLLQLGEELESVVGRLDNRNFISLDTAAKIGAGAATGSPVGSAVGTTAAVVGNPRVKAKTALILHNLQKDSRSIEETQTCRVVL